MKLIKRTKITVIRTESVFLKAPKIADEETVSQIQITKSVEIETPDADRKMIEIKQIKNKFTEKEK